VQTETTPFADSKKNPGAHRSAAQAAVGKLPSTTFGHHSSSDTSVALNGSVLRNLRHDERRLALDYLIGVAY
jgi:hypothetical protein